MAEKDVALFKLENVTPTQKTVGRGAYGRVIEVSTLSVAKELHQTLTDFASPQELARLKQKFLTECHQCSQLCHPNIVQFLGICYPSEDAKLPWLVMEKMDCSLHEYLNVHKPNEVSFQTRISMLHDVTLGLQYLHVQDIIHRDLSSNNILLTKQLVAKIADLGVAKVIDPNRTMSHTQAPGTVIFMPPEALLVKPVYGKPVDVFSLGCVTIHVMTHKWPVPKDEVYINKVTGKKTVREEVERREDYFELIQKPEQLKELIKKCLNDLPEQRPSISDVSKVFRELKPDLKLGKMYSILFEYEPLLLQKSVLENDVKVLEKKLEEEVKQVKEYQEHFIVQEDTINKLRSKAKQNEKTANNAIATLKEEKEVLIQTNQKMSREVARLMSVDVELQNSKKEVEKCKLELRIAEEELQTKKFMINTYKEDFEAECKDRENAHKVKEDEIRKVRIQMETFEAQCQEKVHNIRQTLEAQLNTLKEQSVLENNVKELEKKLEEDVKQVKEYQERIIAQEDTISKLESKAKQNEKTANDAIAALKQEKEALIQSNQKMSREVARLISVDLEFKKKVEKYQLELRIAEEELQTKEFIINTYKEDFEAERKDRENAHKVKEDEIRKVRIQMETFEAQCQEKVHNIKQTLEAQLNTLKEQQSQQRQTSFHDHHPNVSTLMDASSNQYCTPKSAKAGMAFQQQPPPSPSSFSQQQAWQIHQEQQPYKMPQQQQQQNFPYLRGQGRGPSHNQPPHYQVRGKKFLPLTDTKRPEKPTQYASEGINEKIRYQADKHRRHQEYERFDSTLQLDPYLICPKCKLQFREGQLPEYRHHIDNCNQ